MKSLIEHDVKIFPHQAADVNLPVGLAAGFAQGVEAADAVGLVLVDRLPPIPTIQDMVDRAGIFNAQLARHGKLFTAAPDWCH